MAPRPSHLDLVMATWCPHCVPLSVEMAEQLGRKLKVPVRTLDIDYPAMEREADRLVQEYGDWTDDYLIPQAFLTFDDGKVEHLLTGIPGSVDGTRRAWAQVIARY